MDYFSASLELKTVDVGQRLISGYAAAHHNIDRVRDIIDPAASAKAVARLTAPSDVATFIGHDTSALPIGIPQRIEATPRGLYTETYILKGAAGDNLLAVAKDLQDHGQPLGMSIGYKTHDSRHEQTGRGRVRRLLDYELKEYSFAAHQAIANPEAVVTGVKARRKVAGIGSNDLSALLAAAVNAGTGGKLWIRDVYDDFFVYMDEDARLWKRTYTVDTHNQVRLGDPEEVTASTTYEPLAKTTSRRRTAADRMGYGNWGDLADAKRKALGEGVDAAGGMLVPPDEKEARMAQYRVAQENGTWVVYRDADADGDADDNRPIGDYDSEATANAVVAALRTAAADDEDEDDDAAVAAAAGKVAGGAPERKAEWTGAYVDDLDDSAFLFVEDGGTKDGEGKTVPRSKRHFPYKDKDGKIDLPHLRNAVARIPQSDAPGLNKDALQNRARRMLGTADDGKVYEEPEEWKSGAPLMLLGFSYRLGDLADALIDEHKAMRLLGEETKDRMRIRPEMRAQIATLVAELKKLVDWAETIDAGEDGRQRAAWLRQRLALTEL